MIKQMTSDGEILSTFEVMRQLRTHLSRDEYVERVRRQQQTNNYNLAAVLDGDGSVKCVAGYRFAEGLAWGRFLYVDDLVTDGSERSRGSGHEMMAWLAAEARRRGCEQLHLDSGVQRHAAHRFYLRERMDITCYHFALTL